jgi:hypothetical protein
MPGKQAVFRVSFARRQSGTQKNRNFPSQISDANSLGPLSKGTALPCLREMRDLRSSITQVIALGE